MTRGRAPSGAFTLIELLISTAVTSIIVAALFSGAVAMQKCFAAAEDFSNAKCEQMRVTDYLALDLRRALSVTPGTGGTILVATIPDYYEANGAPRVPSIAGRVVNYGNAASPATVTYTKSGSSIYRQETGGPNVEIASGVSDFQVTVQDLEKVVKTRISFAPKFQQTGTADARLATTVYNTTLLRNKRRDRS